MEGVYGDIDCVVIAVDDFYHLLHDVSLWHSDESAEASDAMVDVDNVVADFELLKFFECQCYFAVACFVVFEVVLVEAVEDLVVGEKGSFSVVVDESFVDGVVYGGEKDVVDLCVSHFLKDVFQSLYLFFAVCKDTDVVACVDELVARVGYETEVFVEEWLDFGVEVDGGGVVCWGDFYLQMAE